MNQLAYTSSYVGRNDSLVLRSFKFIKIILLVFLRLKRKAGVRDIEHVMRNDTHLMELIEAYIFWCFDNNQVDWKSAFEQQAIDPLLEGLARSKQFTIAYFNTARILEINNLALHELEVFFNMAAEQRQLVSDLIPDAIDIYGHTLPVKIL